MTSMQLPYIRNPTTRTALLLLGQEIPNRMRERVLKTVALPFSAAASVRNIYDLTRYAKLSKSRRVELAASSYSWRDVSGHG